MVEGEPTSTDEAGEVAADRREPTASEISWNVDTSPDPAGGSEWRLWTDDRLWLPLPVTGRAASQEDAIAVAQTRPPPSFGGGQLGR